MAALHVGLCKTTDRRGRTNFQLVGSIS